MEHFTEYTSKYQKSSLEQKDDTFFWCIFVQVHWKRSTEIKINIITDFLFQMIAWLKDSLDGWKTPDFMTHITNKTEVFAHNL